jgi:phosphoribosylanthranilate isomerase
VAHLVSNLADEVLRVGLVVDADDSTIGGILEHVPLEFLQCHGSESPARVAEIKSRFQLPVIKAINIAGPKDVERARDYEQDADWMLFDAKPPKSMPNALPGGNALAFDWTLIADCSWTCPWMLSGGLDVDNVTEAVKVSGAQVVDVSSGVEDRPGAKNPARIVAFLDAVRAI